MSVVLEGLFGFVFFFESFWQDDGANNGTGVSSKRNRGSATNDDTRHDSMQWLCRTDGESILLKGMEAVWCVPNAFR